MHCISIDNNRSKMTWHTENSINRATWCIHDDKQSYFMPTTQCDKNMTRTHLTRCVEHYKSRVVLCKEVVKFAPGQMVQVLLPSNFCPLFFRGWRGGSLGCPRIQGVLHELQKVRLLVVRNSIQMSHKI